jgi:hypothetical protein
LPLENSAKAINLTLDGSSTWVVTADSYLTSLVDTAGISRTTITNITGNGHTVFYDPSACPGRTDLFFERWRLSETSQLKTIPSDKYLKEGAAGKDQASSAFP